MRNAIARITVAFGALSVAACGGQSGAIPGSGARVPAYATQADESRTVMRQTGGVTAQAQETVLYSFAGSDGADPEASLTDVNGILYGTTVHGGANGAGTVFEITTSGTESVLYSFAGGSDGANPYAGLTDVNGVLYGTTSSGGANGVGTVFEITPSGAESVLYSFLGQGHGANPRVGLTDLNGVLYGTTSSNNNNKGDSTVFKITTSGAESVLYHFTDPGDGLAPMGGLTAVNGVLYGTTSGGGSHGNGTVFKITTSGRESVLYSFAGGDDGASPYAGLTNVNGVLYGTTFYGAPKSNGTVFKITTSGTEKVLHRFGGGSDGQNPLTVLTNLNGVLYGTTLNGGGGVDFNAGTVFKITTSGVKSAVYSFVGGSDGSGPCAGLTNVNGMLYGTTYRGGSNKKGTVYSLSL